MKRIWTIIGVRDVRGSFTWYQSLFGHVETSPAHDHFGQILDTDGTVLLCLHRWGAHEHPSLMSPEAAPPGNGLLFEPFHERACPIQRHLVVVNAEEQEQPVAG